MRVLAIPAIVVVLSAVVACAACSSSAAGDPFARAIVTVSKEIPSSNAAGVSSSDLAAARIPRGSGVVVYVKNRKTQRFTWVVLDGQPYACNDETKGLTPAVPYTSNAKWDTWKQTGLDPANTAAFYEIVDAAERMEAR